MIDEAFSGIGNSQSHSYSSPTSLQQNSSTDEYFTKRGEAGRRSKKCENEAESRPIGPGLIIRPGLFVRPKFIGHNLCNYLF